MQNLKYQSQKGKQKSHLSKPKNVFQKRLYSLQIAFLCCPKQISKVIHTLYCPNQLDVQIKQVTIFFINLSKQNLKKRFFPVLTNSLLVKTPLVSSQVKSSILPGSSQLSSLGPGTLVFANGAVLPLLPPPIRPFSIFPTTTPAPISTLIIVTTKNATHPPTAPPIDTKAVATKINSYPLLKPKSITQTTQVNKVPIPALTSKCNKHKCLEEKKAVSVKNTDVKDVGGSRKKVAESDNPDKGAKKFKSSQIEHNTEKTTDVVKKPEVAPKSSANTEKEVVNHSEEVIRLSHRKSVENVPEVTTAPSKITENPSSSQTNLHIDNPFQLCSEPAINQPTISSASFVLNELASHEETKGQPKDSSKDCVVDSSQKHVLNNELQTELKSLELHLPSAELSNDIFASFHVPPGCQNQESTSPTAAFLLAFPLVSSGTKVAEVMEENAESQAGTPNLLQIGTMDIAKPTQSYSDGLTPNLLNFDNFNFFGSKEPCSGFYNSGSSVNTTGKNMSNFAVSGNFVQNKNTKVSGENKFTADTSKQTNHSGGSKFPDYHMQMKETNSDRSVKMQGLIQGNTVDISSDIFSFKTPSVNDNYTNKNCSSYPTAKFPCNYTNYKTGTNSQQFMMDSAKHQYTPVYTSASVSNNFFNSFSADDYINTDGYTNDFQTKKSLTCAQSYQKEKPQHNLHQQKTKTQPNKLINWMTTPTTTTTTVSCKSDYFLPPALPSTNSTFTNTNNYFNSSVYSNSNDHLTHQIDPVFNKKTSDTNYNTGDENQFTWSPSKIPQFLDPQSHSFVPSTLPTLVGDLALNTTPLVENKTYNKERVSNTLNRPSRKVGACENQNQSSFFSVSQLVENQESGPAKIVSRRNSGNRSKNNTSKGSKRPGTRSDSNKEVLSGYQKNEKSGFNISVANNLFSGDKQPSRANNSKNIRSSYSAEALIGNHVPTERNNFCQTHSTNKGLVSNFINESMYFPSIEVTQDNNYSTQNYHHSNVTTFPQHFTTTFNSGYSGNNFTSTFTSSYMPSNTFMTSNTQDFLADTSNLFQNNPAPSKEKCNFSPKNYYKHTSDKVADKNQSYNCKKSKKRPINDNVLPSLDIHFLSMPGTINSPILPDDFHATYLPPNTLYPCKNPLYTKNSDTVPNTLIPPLHSSISGGRSAIQHPQMSPSVNSAGNTLTNFNLSTICPEIDKVCILVLGNGHK